MRRLLSIAAAGVLAAALTLPLSAQPLEEEVEEGLPGIAGGDPAADPGAFGISPDATAATAGTVTLHGVIASIEAGHAGADALANVASVSTVLVVPVADLPGGEDVASLERAVEEHLEDIEELRATVRSNDMLAREIEAQDAAVEDIVAADVGADGTITIFIR